MRDMTATIELCDQIIARCERLADARRCAWLARQIDLAQRDRERRAAGWFELRSVLKGGV